MSTRCVRMEGRQKCSQAAIAWVVRSRIYIMKPFSKELQEDHSEKMIVDRSDVHASVADR